MTVGSLFMALPLNIDWRQILLHLFNFAILSGGLYFLLYSPVKKFMDEREKAQRERLENAEQKLKLADETKTENDRREAELSAKEARVTADAEAKAAVVYNEKVEEAKRRADEIIANAKLEGEREKQSIIDGAEEEIERLAVETTEKLLSEATYDSFISYALAEKRKENSAKVTEASGNGGE